MVMSVVYNCLHLHFGRHECLDCRRLPTLPKILSIIVIQIISLISKYLSALTTVK